MKTLDLWLRYAIIMIAWHLACAWLQSFQSPWPLADAFELADSAEEQLFKSLGIEFSSTLINSLLLISRTLIHDSAQTFLRTWLYYFAVKYPGCPPSPSIRAIAAVTLPLL